MFSKYTYLHYTNIKKKDIQNIFLFVIIINVDDLLHKNGNSKNYDLTILYFYTFHFS